MPYSFPDKVPDNVPEDKKRQFMEVFNSVYNDTKDEGKAMASAYSAIKKNLSVGTKVSWNSSGGTARGIIREIVRDGKVGGIPVKVSGTKDDPAARIEIVDDEGEPTGEMVGHKLSTLRKAQYTNDVFTTEAEARSRAADLGLEGTHVYEYRDEVVYMPGSSHEEYLQAYDPDYEEDEEDKDLLERAISAIIEAVTKGDYEDWGEPVSKAEYQGETVQLNKPRRLSGGNKKFEVFVQDGGKVKRVTFGDPNMEIRRDDAEARASFRARHSCDTAKDKTSARYWSCRAWEKDTTVSELTKTDVIKFDDEQRVVWGFASVTKINGETVVDRQGDIIEERVLEKAATEFMLGARNGLTMHKGEPTTTVVHSMLFTPEIKKAFGIESKHDGWLIAVKVHCDDTWKKVKEGEFTGFSIGGRATRKDV